MHHSFWKFSKNRHKICFIFYIANVFENMWYTLTLYGKYLRKWFAARWRNLDRYIVMLNILKIKTLQIYCPWIFMLIEKTQSSAFNLFILMCPFSSIIRYSKNTPRFKQFSFNKLKSQDFSFPSLLLVTGLYSSIPV